MHQMFRDYLDKVSEHDAKDGVEFESIEAAVKALESEHGYVVRSKDQEESFVKNVEKKMADETYCPHLSFHRQG